MSGLKFVRPIDIAVLRVIALTHLVNGIYFIGPWYVTTYQGGDSSPLLSLFGSIGAVTVFGCLLTAQALWMIFAIDGNSVANLSWALLTGFLLRLYSLIGVLLSASDWLPPTYLSHAALVFVLGAYWVWFQRHARLVQ